MASPYINDIINAIKRSHIQASSLEITPDMRFCDIPSIDSMSIVNFQIELSSVIGNKANAVQPVMEMRLKEYAEVLASL